MENSHQFYNEFKSVDTGKCFVTQGAKTPEAGPAAIIPSLKAGDSGGFGDARRILCNAVNSRFICKSRTVQLGQAETRKNASEYIFQVAFLLRQSACLSSL